MKIERITKKDRRNVIINFDDDNDLIINYEVLLKNGLRKGMEVSSDRFSFLVEENEKHKIKTEAINYLAKRIHSEKELRTKLLQKKHKPEMLNEIIDELKEKELIDDYKYSLIFTEEKTRTKLWGERKIKSELMKKGISNEIISQAISEKFPEENKLENAVELASKKIKSLSYKNLEKRKLAEKVYSFLASRGYDYQTSREALERILNENFIE
ncbi:MAG: RecX family transcriptional regulator [Ignavibacteria bacterium]|nr:RecX family transcriptional regulator [Ignavibacteria bacterium]